MTDQQLRALRRKHLLKIIRELESNLQETLLEKEQLMIAYQSGLAQERQNNPTRAESPAAPQQPTGQYIDSGRTDWWQQAAPEQPYAAQYNDPIWSAWQQTGWQQQTNPAQAYTDAWPAIPWQ